MCAYIYDTCIYDANAFPAFGRSPTRKVPDAIGVLQLQAKPTGGGLLNDGGARERP